MYNLYKTCILYMYVSYVFIVSNYRTCVGVFCGVWRVACAYICIHSVDVCRFNETTHTHTHTRTHSQDILHKACTSLKIAPIGRFFFGLKGLKNQCYICPYLPVPPGNQRYQLRVFVSPAQSNFQFQMVSRVLLHYYYHQV